MVSLFLADANVLCEETVYEAGLHISSPDN